jgi:hypothetical protein
MKSENPYVVYSRRYAFDYLRTVAAIFWLTVAVGMFLLSVYLSRKCEFSSPYLLLPATLLFFMLVHTFNEKFYAERLVIKIQLRYLDRKKKTHESTLPQIENAIQQLTFEQIAQII